MTTAAPAERIVAIADLGERLSALRLADAAALGAMRASLNQHGQLSPVRAFERDGAFEIFDGFKRLRAARLLGLRDLRAVISEVDVIDATVQMRELHAGRGLTALEEGWIVRALYRCWRSRRSGGFRTLRRPAVAVTRGGSAGAPEWGVGPRVAPLHARQRTEASWRGHEVVVEARYLALRVARFRDGRSVPARP